MLAVGMSLNKRGCYYCCAWKLKVTAAAGAAARLMVKPVVVMDARKIELSFCTKLSL